MKNREKYRNKIDWKRSRKKIRDSKKNWKGNSSKFRGWKIKRLKERENCKENNRKNKGRNRKNKENYNSNNNRSRNRNNSKNNNSNSNSKSRNNKK